jgi:vacuolar protein sorting-associated protein 13A/C
LEKGAKAIFSGFKDGITGIFLKPYENASKDGFLGFLRGTYQGLSGAVIKPVTGILDFASKTTEGLKNTMMFFEDKPN